MSPAGYHFLLHLAPRIDKVLIPRTNGRLSSAGIDKVGLVTTTGAKARQSRTHPLALIVDIDGLLPIGVQLWPRKSSGVRPARSGSSASDPPPSERACRAARRPCLRSPR